MRSRSNFGNCALLLLLILSQVNSKPFPSSELSSESFTTATQLPQRIDDDYSQVVEVQSNIDSPESVVEVPDRILRNAENFRYKIASESDEFAAQSRRTFLSLNNNQNNNHEESSTALPPDDEERRQLWLSRHHQRKTGTTLGQPQQQQDGAREEPQREREGPLVNPKNLLTLTSADVINQTQTCTGDLFKHKVRMAGCEPKIIINRFCHGSCTSFYIPRLRSKKLKATFQSCSVCVPSETDLVQVRLNCPNRDEREIYRKVMRVKKCACRSIEVKQQDNDTDDEYDNPATDDAGDLGY